MDNKEKLEEAKKLYASANADQKYVLESLFPELKESEDEKIRKELISFLQLPHPKFVGERKQEKWLVWLEKQGNIDKESYEIAEKEKYDFVSGQFIECRKSFNEFKENNSYWLEYVGNDTYIGRSDNILNKKFHITPRQLYRLFSHEHCPKEDSNVNNEANAPTGYGKYVDECLNEASKHFFSEGEDKYSVADLFYAGVRCGKSWLEKQGERKKCSDTCDSSMMDNKKSPYGEKRDFGYFEDKPTDDKVEPKFNVGDWVVVNGETLHIKKVIEGGYLIEGGGFMPFRCEKEARLWTNQDAKDGDILAFYSEYKGNKMMQVGIVKEYVGKHGGCSNTFNIYVGVNWDKNLQIGEYMGCSDIQPATKEQRDALMVAMADAGYVFDFEKKELKKFEKSEEKLFQYIIEERNKPYFYYNGKKDVSWNDMPYIVRKHDYPYHFVGNLDCFPFFSGAK